MNFLLKKILPASATDNYYCDKFKNNIYLNYFLTLNLRTFINKKNYYHVAALKWSKLIYLIEGQYIVNWNY